MLKAVSISDLLTAQNQEWWVAREVAAEQGKKLICSRPISTIWVTTITWCRKTTSSQTTLSIDLPQQFSNRKVPAMTKQPCSMTEPSKNFTTLIQKLNLSCRCWSAKLLKFQKLKWSKNTKFNCWCPTENFSKRSGNRNWSPLKD